MNWPQTGAGFVFCRILPSHHAERHAYMALLQKLCKLLRGDDLDVSNLAQAEDLPILGDEKIRPGRGAS
jgi:hypothetical protein